MVNRLLEWLVDAYKPTSLSILPVEEPAPVQQPSVTANLYMLHMDFPVSKEQRTEIEQGLDILRKKYGIDFMLLEPGIKLSRFDDI